MRTSLEYRRVNRFKQFSLPIILSFLAIYIIWGSTYLLVAFSVEEIPPFILAAIRFLVASTLVFILVWLFFDFKEVSKVQIKNAMIAGILFLAIGNGGMSFALQYIDSGYSALLTSGQPLILLFMLWTIDKKPLPLKAWIGVALGILGMFLLVSQQELMTTDQQLLGTVIIFGCLISWGLGSIFVNRAELPKSSLLNTGIQMLTGGIFLLVVSFVAQEDPVEWHTISMRAWGSLLGLIIFGSIVAFTAFNYLLTKVSPEKVSTCTYVNPIVALLLGYYFRDELLTSQTMVAAVVLLTGVYFINTNKSKATTT